MVKLVSLEKPSMIISVIINMSKNDNQSKIVFSKFNEIVQKFLQKDIEYHGTIVQDKVVIESIMRQVPLALYSGKSSAMQSIRGIARNLLGLKNTKQRTIFNR